jgi:hypothetical protein
MERRFSMKIALASLVLAGCMVLFGSTADAQRSSYGYGGGVHASHYGPSRGYVHSRVWIPGRYESGDRALRIPGSCERVWVARSSTSATTTVAGPCAVLVSTGHWQSIERPGHYEERCSLVWRPGHWAPRGSC